MTRTEDDEVEKPTGFSCKFCDFEAEYSDDQEYEWEYFDDFYWHLLDEHLEDIIEMAVDDDVQVKRELVTMEACTFIETYEEKGTGIRIASCPWCSVDVPSVDVKHLAIEQELEDHILQEHYEEYIEACGDDVNQHVIWEKALDHAMTEMEVSA